MTMSDLTPTDLLELAARVEGGATLQAGDPIWMPDLGDKPAGPYWTFVERFEGRYETVVLVRAPNGFQSEYPDKYVQRAPPPVPALAFEVFLLIAGLITVLCAAAWWHS